ncbi:MAG: hypothetical protein HYX68_20240 [Planctomycetes bacterium]|nr:hypothetical protein [Planctomycetota bacterium]
MDVKAKVNDALAVLEGLPLWSIGRAGSLEWFAFGAKKNAITIHNKQKVVGEFALHLDCPWKLLGVDGSLLADDQSDLNLLAALAEPALLCGRREAGEMGDFRLDFFGGVSLMVHASDQQGDGEYWRLFQPYSGLPHFVVGSNGVENEG